MLYYNNIIRLSLNISRYIGQLTLSPMSVAPVCHVGDPLQLTCTAALAGSVQTIRWSIFQIINDQGTLSEITNSVLIDNNDVHQSKTKEVASVIFTYSRISAQGASPLVSMLSIDSVSIGLNRAVVNCSDVANPMKLLILVKVSNYSSSCMV